MIFTPELAERVQDIYREKLELHFGDSLTFGPITAEPTQNSEGDPLFVVTIVYDGQPGNLDAGKAMQALTTAASTLLTLGIRALPPCHFVFEQEYPRFMKARSRLSRQAALSLEPLPGRPIPSDTLVFGYTVKPEDSDSDGISMDGGYQDSNGTWHNLINHEAITATGTETVVYRVYDGIGDQAGHKVDGSLVPVGTGTEITSNPDSGDTYRYGETIEFSITFSAPLEVEGSRHLSLRVGSDDSDGWRAATYLRGSGTNTLVFGYTVQTGDLDDDGVAMLGTWVENGKVHGLGGSGTVKVKGTDVPVTPTFTGLSDQAAHRLDGHPYPRTISITSKPFSKSDSYGRDEIIQVSVNFGQSVTAGEDAFAILRIGSLSHQRNAQYASGNGTDTLAFEYTVVERDSDENGVDAFVPHGQDIRATGTDIAYQPNPGGVTPTLGEDSNHKVDGSLFAADVTAPTVSSISIVDFPGPGDDNTYGAGEWIGVLVIFNESVLATGSPQVELDIGGTVRHAEYGIAPSGMRPDSKARITPHPGLIFGYTVQQGDSDSDGIAIGANKVTLNGGTIRDEAKNDAVLTHAAVAADSGHLVRIPDTTAPTISTISITSDPGDDYSYVTGDVIEITVTFSEDVVVAGTPQLELNFYDYGSANKQADYSSVNGAAVVFSYTLVAGDSASDGLRIRANQLTLNGGGIEDGAGNDAVLTHGVLGPDADHLVSSAGGL